MNRQSNGRKDGLADWHSSGYIWFGQLPFEQTDELDGGRVN